MGCTGNGDALGLSVFLWIRLDPGAEYEETLDALGVPSELKSDKPILNSCSEPLLAPLCAVTNSASLPSLA